MSTDSDDFARQLKKDWLTGRSEQIHERLSQVFRKYLAEDVPTRAQQLVTALDEAPLVPGVSPKDQAATQVMMAWSQAVAEGALVAVAIYLAAEELRDPPAT